MELGDLPGWIAAVVAVAAFAISVWATFRGEKLAQALQRSENYWRMEIDKHGSITERVREIHEWGGRVLLVVAEMHEFVKAGREPDPKHQSQLLAMLSAAIDEGRLLFPNEGHDRYGLHKSQAYRGVRQPILDDLVYIYDLFRTGDLFGLPAGVAEFDELRRDFVSQLQVCANPERLTIEQLREERALRDSSSALFKRAKASAEAQIQR